MGRFSAIVRGIDAPHHVSFRLVDGTEVRCAVRALLGSELSSVLTDARAYAVARGVAEPTDTNPIYQLGVWVYTLAIACVDIDSPGQTFFDGGAQQILDGLDVDRIALLYEAQQSWQDYCAPVPKRLGGDEFIAKILEIADSEEGDERPFERLPRGLLESFTRSTTKLLVAAQPLRSGSGMGAEPNTQSATSRTDA